MSLTRLRLTVVLLLAVCGFVAVPRPVRAEDPKAAEAIDFANTYAVVVGVLKWEDKGLATFSPENRKDKELYDILRKRGVPADNMSLLLDEQATLANIRKELQRIAADAKPDSTLIVYYAGHGGRRPDGGTDFINYDYSPRNKDKPALAVREISDILIEKKFQGARVLLLADCCHSGGLQDVVRSLAKAKIKAAALTSADPLCLSTGSWCFSQTVIAAFAGDPLLDANADATISLGELAGEVEKAMQFRERQRYGFLTEGIPLDFGLAPTDPDKKKPEALKGDFPLKEYVTARDESKKRTGRIVGFRDEKYAVEFYGYSDKQVVLFPAAALTKIKYRSYKVGDSVLIARAGMPKATVLEVAGSFHRVSYPDHPAWKQEWVLSDRIIEDPQAAAEVEWKGDWYQAVILKKTGEKYHIHYVGFDDSWDEVVTKERIRFPGTAPTVRNPFDVPDPTGADVKKYAEMVKLAGDADDKNAEQWVKKETEGKKDSLDGDWSGRWASGSGSAKVKVIKDRVYILYTEEAEGEFKGRKYLVEAVRDKDRLVGRWVAVDNPEETGPFAGRIVDDERLDGAWGGDARWDFRRKLKK